MPSTWVGISCLPNTLQVSCEAVRLMMDPSPVESLALRMRIPFLRVMAVTLRVGPATRVTITLRAFTDDYSIQFKEKQYYTVMYNPQLCQLSWHTHTFWLSFLPDQYSSMISACSAVGVDGEEG